MAGTCCCPHVPMPSAALRRGRELARRCVADPPPGLAGAASVSYPQRQGLQAVPTPRGVVLEAGVLLPLHLV